MNKNIMLFSKRAKLAEEYEKWVNQPLADGAKIKDCPLSVITFMLMQGFSKIPEDGVVLSGKQCAEIVQDNYNIGYERGSKETAKEFAEKLKESLDISVIGYSTSEVISNVKDTIDNVAKQFGVEVEE